jgi:adenosylcobinamide-phosphate synthase
MSFLSLLVTLLIEQLRPLNPRNAVFLWYTRYVHTLGLHYNTGEKNQGTVAWWLGVLPWVMGVGLMYWFLSDISLAFGWAWNVAVLYLTLGFRQFSHAFTEISEALRVGDLERARAALSGWHGESAAQYNDNEIAKVAIEEGLIGAHRHVFGVMFWFLILPGPCGAVLYRLAAILDQKWGSRARDEYGAFGLFAAQAFRYIDWIPVRLTALSFAVAGNFEDAMHCWRSQAAAWVRPEQGIVLASGAGALGVRLGETLHHGGKVDFRPELGLGGEADANTMISAAAMIWRALVIWMLIIFLVTIARWLGG